MAHVKQRDILVRQAYVDGYRTIAAISRHTGLSRYHVELALKTLGLSTRMLRDERTPTSTKGDSCTFQEFERAMQEARLAVDAARPVNYLDIRVTMEKLYAPRIFIDSYVQKLLRQFETSRRNSPTTSGRPPLLTDEQYEELYLMTRDNLTLEAVYKAMCRLRAPAKRPSRSAAHKYHVKLRETRRVRTQEQAADPSG